MCVCVFCYCCFVGLCTHLKLYLSVILCFKEFVDQLSGICDNFMLYTDFRHVSVDCTVVSRKQEYVIYLLLFLSVVTFVLSLALSLYVFVRTHTHTHLSLIHI